MDEFMKKLNNYEKVGVPKGAGTDSSEMSLGMFLDDLRFGLQFLILGGAVTTTTMKVLIDGKGVVGAVDGGKGKAPRGRRSWTRVEEDALIQCLLGIMNDGWKADNGFKTGKSGIGWNSTSNTLDIIDETVWDAQRKADSGVKSLRYKSFPYYDSWLDIFGKDRATGEHAADPIQFKR
ncbi:hypothetical protein ACS0TY_020322 [Phlomoides rotata]